MNSSTAEVRSYLNTAGGHLIALAVAFVSAYAASHGLDAHIPALPAAITATGALAFVRTAAGQVAKAWHTKKLQAVLIADLKRDAAGIAKDTADAVRSA